MSRPPKMRLPYAPGALRLVADQPVEKEREDQASRLIRGVAYTAEQWHAWLGIATELSNQQAMISAYSLKPNCAIVSPLQADAAGFIWDSQGLPGLATAENECLMLDSGLGDLTIEEGIRSNLLTVTPSFTLRYKTSAFPAKLGEVRLVTSQRFVTDVNGGRHVLVDTQDAGGPVLFVEDRDDFSVIKQITPWQSLDEEREYRFDYRISQSLQNTCCGVPVQSITVLEQYTSYFLQRAMAAKSSETIWVPAYPPMNWGWSLRVEPEQDDWVITRRKLILPMEGQEGLQLPRWRSNLLVHTTELGDL